MNKVVVPQFLDIEDKIIGAISVRQFIEMIIAGLLIFIFYKIFDFSLFLLSAIIVAALTLTLAFVKVNGQSFHIFLLNFISTMRHPKLKVWKRQESIEKAENKNVEEKSSQLPAVKRPLQTSHLSELSLIVDTGGAYTGEENK